MLEGKIKIAIKNDLKYVHCLKLEPSAGESVKAHL